MVRMCIPKPHHAICRVPNIQHGVVHTIAAADHIAHLGNIAGAVCGNSFGSSLLRCFARVWFAAPHLNTVTYAIPMETFFFTYSYTRFLF